MGGWKVLHTTLLSNPGWWLGLIVNWIITRDKSINGGHFEGVCEGFPVKMHWDYFSHCSHEIPDPSNLRKWGFFLAHDLRFIVRQKAWWWNCGWSHCCACSWNQRETDAGARLTPAHSEEVGLPCSFRHFWKQPQGHMQRYVFLEILNLIKLTMKINHHRREDMSWVGRPIPWLESRGKSAKE